MKVKIGELKTHLSRYLRQLEKDQEPIAVCLREETVAYLVPAGKESPDPAHAAVRERLEGIGLSWGDTGTMVSPKELSVHPVKLRGVDRRDDTVAAMRSAKGW